MSQIPATATYNRDLRRWNDIDYIGSTHTHSNEWEHWICCASRIIYLSKNLRWKYRSVANDAKIRYSEFCVCVAFVGWNMSTRCEAGRLGKQKHHFKLCVAFNQGLKWIRYYFLEFGTSRRWAAMTSICILQMPYSITRSVSFEWYASYPLCQALNFRCVGNL